MKSTGAQLRIRTGALWVVVGMRYVDSLGDQSGPFDSQGEQGVAGAGLASVQAQVPHGSCEYRHHSGDYLRLADPCCVSLMRRGSASFEALSL
jgi:hypothetical protein